MVHADVYRLGSAADVRELGLANAGDDGWLVLVEWGEPYVELLGGDALIVSLASSRAVARFSATGTRSAELLAALQAPLLEELTWPEAMSRSRRGLVAPVLKPVLDLLDGIGIVPHPELTRCRG